MYLVDLTLENNDGSHNLLKHRGYSISVLTHLLTCYDSQPSINCFNHYQYQYPTLIEAFWNKLCGLNVCNMAANGLHLSYRPFSETIKSYPKITMEGRNNAEQFDLYYSCRDEDDKVIRLNSIKERMFFVCLRNF